MHRFLSRSRFLRVGGLLWFGLSASVVLAAENPLLEREWKTPFGSPPFDRIRAEHFLPAFKEAIARHDEEIARIASGPVPATFENTIEALALSGELLERTGLLFDALDGAATGPELRRVADEAAPLRTRHTDAVLMNGALFARVRAVWEGRERAGLAGEKARLAERTFKEFVRNGASLEASRKDRLRKINEELSLLELRFANNILAETNAYALVLDKKEDLAGLPPSTVEAAAEAAKAKGYEGRWVFTLEDSSCVPFEQYSQRRDLREKLYRAYLGRANLDDEYDNKAIASRIVSLRLEKARLLGFATYAAWALDDQMARTPERVLALLDRIRAPAMVVADREADEYRALIRSETGRFRLEPWDWAFYATKAQKARYSLDDESLRPYFKLGNVLDGAFGVATRLYGIRFVERKDIPAYHPDVRVFEVREKTGEHIGLLFLDYFPRESKRSGAWMLSLRNTSCAGGRRVTPIVCNVGNFTKPTASVPSLLPLDEVKVLFHEFGHALHGLFSRVSYPKLGDVPIDFVELPSQIMENWAVEPAVLPTYAKHHVTGEPMPADLVDRLQKARLFNQGFSTVEYLASSYLDLHYHMWTASRGPSIPSTEREVFGRVGLIREIEPRYRSHDFEHIFGSADYAAGYYSYVWSEVLDADAFELFKKKGIFDPETAESFRRTILEKGSSEEALELYRRFRGAEPSVEPLLKRRGLLPR